MTSLRSELLTRMLPADQQHIVNLYRRMPRAHLHLDWRTLEAWLPDPDLNGWVLRRGNRIHAFLGAAVNRIAPDQTDDLGAWLRMIVPAGVNDGTLDGLWHALRDSLHAQGVNEVAVLALDEWVELPIAKWGFEVSTAVVTMRRIQGPQPTQPEPPLRTRPASVADMPAIAQLDASAFGKLWHYNLTMLRFAQLHAASFTVLEDAGRILGYQLSTAHAKSGHLARLAVTPDVQGQGLGALLLGDMMRHFEEQGMTTLTVNTQEDNIRSQRLYKRFGFDYIGFKVPVWTVSI